MMELLPRLATGEVSRDLDAAICVALQYVPGVPGACNVRVAGSGPKHLEHGAGTKATDADWYFAATPPLTSDLNAVVVVAFGLPREMTKGRTFGAVVIPWGLGSTGVARDERMARAGADALANERAAISCEDARSALAGENV